MAIALVAMAMAGLLVFAVLALLSVTLRATTVFDESARQTRVADSALKAASEQLATATGRASSSLEGSILKTDCSDQTYTFEERVVTVTCAANPHRGSGSGGLHVRTVELTATVTSLSGATYIRGYAALKLNGIDPVTGARYQSAKLDVQVWNLCGIKSAKSDCDP